jgi:hypothetical protein
MRNISFSLPSFLHHYQAENENGTTTIPNGPASAEDDLKLMTPSVSFDLDLSLHPYISSDVQQREERHVVISVIHEYFFFKKAKDRRFAIQENHTTSCTLVKEMYHRC